MPDLGIPENESVVLTLKVFENNFNRNNDFMCSCSMAWFIMSCETIGKIIQWIKKDIVFILF